MRKFMVGGLAACGAIAIFVGLLVAFVERRGESAVHPLVEVKGVSSRLTGVAPRVPAGAGFVCRGGLTPAMAVIPGGVMVAGDLSLEDSEPEAHHVWVVRGYMKAGYDDEKYVKPAFEKVYADQIFSVVPGEALRTTFDDLFQPVPPGDYVLELSLSRLPPGMALGDVRGSEHLWGLTTARCTQRLVVE